jgi:hypothetical protein
MIPDDDDSQLFRHLESLLFDFGTFVLATTSPLKLFPTAFGNLVNVILSDEDDDIEVVKSVDVSTADAEVGVTMKNGAVSSDPETSSAALSPPVVGVSQEVGVSPEISVST